MLKTALKVHNLYPPIPWRREWHRMAYKVRLVAINQLTVIVGNSVERREPRILNERTAFGVLWPYGNSMM